MKIECLTTFLDGADRFEIGDLRTVEDARGARLCANGWARDLSGSTATGAASGDADLVIHNSTLNAGDNHV